jgi:hypothetical protein
MTATFDKKAADFFGSLFVYVTFTAGGRAAVETVAAGSGTFVIYHDAAMAQ